MMTEAFNKDGQQLTSRLMKKAFKIEEKGFDMEKPKIWEAFSSKAQMGFHYGQLSFFLFKGLR